EATVYNRLADMEWNTPIGPAAACGGDAMMRRSALSAVGGYREDLIAGEEPELCLRLARAGWQIERLDAEMTGHDAGITRFGQWWKRCVRGGWAAAEGAALHGRAAEAYNVARLRSIVIWGALVPGGTVLAGLLAAVLAAGGSALSLVPAAMGAGGLGLMVLQGLRIARDRVRRFGDAGRHAALYGLFTMLGKLPQMQGVIRYGRHARRGGRARLIEYRSEG
ncbi:MAG: glycosyltransferase family 2 protein, partial [Pseudomonadota bacterium]